MLPFGLDNSRRVYIPLNYLIMGILTMLLLGCDEVANRLDDPFQFFPVEQLV